MKIKENFVLRQVADTWVVLPLGAATLDFNGMLTLNNSGKMLWHLLEQGADFDTLAMALVEEYDVSHEQVAADVEEFIQKLLQTGCLEES